MLQHELLGLDRRLPAASFQAPSCKVCLVILFLLLFALLLIMSLMLSVTNISNSISITITAIMLRLSLAWPSPLFWPNIVSSMEKTF